MKVLLAATALTLGLAAAAAADPVKTLPDSYSLQFENEWVKVVRVHYAPHAKLPAHAHTRLASAYVYLNDSGPVLFRHVDAPYGPATRPPTKAGGFRVYRGLEEIHEVENLSDLPSDFLRVEFKTDPGDPRTLRGRFFREPYPAGENVERVQFENEQVRITRVVGAPGRTLRLSTTDTEPALLIALSAARLAGVTLAVGQERWIPAGTTESLANSGDEPAEMLRFDFKTLPLK